MNEKAGAVELSEKKMMYGAWIPPRFVLKCVQHNTVETQAERTAEEEEGEERNPINFSRLILIQFRITFFMCAECFERAENT